jgi:3-deoxy-D-manno-octulosonic-acid transferase
MIRFLYSLLMRALMPFMWLKLRLRARREPMYGEWMDERFGYYPQPALAGALWIHAVSLGETRSIGALVKALRETYPDLRLLLTHGTATGRSEGLSLLRVGDVQAWLPWDTPGAVNRFLRQFRPRLGLLIETEIWPNLTAIAKQQGVPLVLVNARLSERSWRTAKYWSVLSAPTYSGLQTVWAQTEEDAKRLRSLGAPVSAVMGNLKFDAHVDTQSLAIGHAWRKTFASRPVVMLAISREQEEAMFLEVLQQHPEYLTQAQWWIVPRHPQRFDEVASLMQATGLPVHRRSEWPDNLSQLDAPLTSTLVLGDSLGEMPFYYGAASVAILGGSFAPLGGQNLIEACACACPVVMGPHTLNFKQAAQWALAEQAALRCPDMASAIRQALALALDKQRQEAMSQAGLQFARSHQGAVANCMTALRKLLD